MKKYIIGLFLIGFMLAPGLSFAQVADPDPNPTVSDCVALQSSNLRYKARDINTNNEVSTLQDFLQSQGYLNNEPTGYFGLLTVKAVKSFQKSNGISPTGYVGQITRGVIKNLTCGGVYPNSGNVVISGVSGPQTLNVNQTGTWIVKATDSNGGVLSYSVNWGEYNDLCTSSVTPCAMFKSAQAIQQSATFTHSYARAGIYTITFTVTSDNGIRCFTTPCPSGGSATTSLSVNVGGTIEAPSLKVISPNGGETLIKGNSQVIQWQDNQTFSCPAGAPCAQPLDRYYDISLVSYYTPCTSDRCPMMAYRAPYTIAKKVFGSSYSWKVGDVINDYASDMIAPDGSYTIQVCRTDTGVCDSSDSYFKIATANSLVISGVSGPQTLNVNQTGTWTVSAYDKNGGNLSYLVSWGDETVCSNGTCATNIRGILPQQSATFTHSYSQTGTYTPTFTVTNTSGQSATTSLSVKVGSVVSSPSITVVSPNGGETIQRGQLYTIKWDTTGLSPSDHVSIFLKDDSLNCLSGMVGCWTEFGIGSSSNTGSYTWDTNQKMFGDGGPNSQPVYVGNNFRIYLRVESVNNSMTTVSDYSDNHFTIQ